MRNCHYEENELKNHVTAPLTKPNFLLYMQFWLDCSVSLHFSSLPFSIPSFFLPPSSLLFRLSDATDLPLWPFPYQRAAIFNWWAFTNPARIIIGELRNTTCIGRSWSSNIVQNFLAFMWSPVVFIAHKKIIESARPNASNRSDHKKTLT